MGFISADRTQGHLFGYTLEDLVAPDAKCRHIARYIDRLDLSAFYADYSDQGGDAFDPRIMLATWFLAYSEGITSTRKVEQLCRRDLHFIYISGHLQPDHTSLSRFRQRHSDRLADVFVQIVRLGVEDGVSTFDLIAIDGTKVEARGSRRQLRTGKQLEAQLEKVRATIQDYLQQCELLDVSSQAQDIQQVTERIEQLKALEQKLLDRQQTLEQRKRTLQSKDRAKHKINLTEPDARSMNKVNGKRAAPAYNAQVSVDTASGLIVGQTVTDAPTDQQQFSEQHQTVEATLSDDPDRQYVADAGYNSLDQLEYIDHNEVDAVVADPRPEYRSGDPSKAKPLKTYPRSMFTYDSARDEYRCPAGKTLSYWYTERRRGTTSRMYICRDCPVCPQHAACRGKNAKPGSRIVRREEREPLAEAMSQKSRSDPGLARLATRRQTVEPVIGNVKSNLGFRRFGRGGMAAVRGEWALMCIAHNLNRLIGLVRGPLSASLRLLGSFVTDRPAPQRFLIALTGRRPAGRASAA